MLCSKCQAETAPSQESRGQYFASLREAWLNLPEQYSKKFPTPEHLRKYALIKTGWRDETDVVLDSYGAALEVALLARKLDPYAVIVHQDSVVTVLLAVSQSHQEQGKEDFQKSKSAVLDYVWGHMIGVSPDEATRAIEGIA